MEYLLLFIGLCLVFRFGRVPVRAVAFAAVCLWGAYEAAYGLLQILGLRPSLNPAFVLTGHFENPGPYGGFIAMTMAVSGAYLMRFWRRRRGFYRAVMFGIAVLNFTLGLLVLPASMSRAAWVALAVSLLLSLLMDRRLRTWIHRHLLLCGVLAGLALIAVGGAFMMKRDSALGRLHIWRIEAIAISEHPLGTGPGTALGTYGKTQEQFFRERLHDVPESVVRVAGCPEFPFNEYLGIGMEFGVPGLVLSLIVMAWAIFVLVRRRDLMASGLIAWAVFALASYPLSVVQTSVLLLVFLASAVPSWNRAASGRKNICQRAIAVAGAAVALFTVMHPSRLEGGLMDRSAYRELYGRGYLLYQSGQYEESYEVLERGSQISSDPMFHVIMGRNSEALGDNVSAEDEYLTAWYMVPCRIYPLVRLMRLKIRCGDNAGAVLIGEKIVSMPVREGHRNMLRLKNEAAASLDSLIYLQAANKSGSCGLSLFRPG